MLLNSASYRNHLFNMQNIDVSSLSTPPVGPDRSRTLHLSPASSLLRLRGPRASRRAAPPGALRRALRGAAREARGGRLPRGNAQEQRPGAQVWKRRNNRRGKFGKSKDSLRKSALLHNKGLGGLKLLTSLSRI